jgi:hypothetical protein
VTELNLKDTGMGCVLRVWGEDFAVDELLSRVNLRPCKIFRKGQKEHGPNSNTADNTGFYVVTSERSENDLDGQVEDTIDYLTTHRTELASIMSFPGVQSATLDFSVSCKIGANRIVVQNDFLPVELIKLSGELGLAINLSLYPGRHMDW